MSFYFQVLLQDLNQHLIYDSIISQLLSTRDISKLTHFSSLDNCINENNCINQF